MQVAERYVMSDQGRDEIVGQAFRKRKEAEAQLAELKAEARRIGEVLYAVGQGLLSFPESVSFGGESMDGRFNRTHDFMPHQVANITQSKLQSLCNEIRSAQIDLWDYEKQIKSLGY
ncbi:MAG TPA: hypothetical protein VGY31_01665 [Terriglobia bacterium]|nr:hypothetical protein [Terriglobia bacterium]